MAASWRCWYFNSFVPQCFELLDSFLGRGYTEIDTALVYDVLLVVWQ